MKKILSILIITVMCLSFITGCTETPAETDEKQDGGVLHPGEYQSEHGLSEAEIPRQSRTAGKYNRNERRDGKVKGVPD